MTNQRGVDFLAQKVIKYASVDRKNSQINLNVPFILWEEWYEDAKEVEKDNICWAYLHGGDKKFLSPSLYYIDKFKL